MKRMVVADHIIDCECICTISTICPVKAATPFFRFSKLISKIVSLQFYLEIIKFAKGKYTPDYI